MGKDFPGESMEEKQGAGGTCKGIITVKDHALGIRQIKEEEIRHQKITGPVFQQSPKN